MSELLEWSHFKTGENDYDRVFSLESSSAPLNGFASVIASPPVRTGSAGMLTFADVRALMLLLLCREALGDNLRPNLLDTLL